MSIRTINDIAAAILSACVFCGICVLAGNAAFEPRIPARPAFELPDDPAVRSIPLETLLAHADASRGAALATALCSNCHRFDKDAPTLVGPDLYGVTGRNIGSIPGFDFSPALAAHHMEHWTNVALFSWLESPSAFAVGTRMTFVGIDRQADRADIIAYLMTLKASPSQAP